LWSTGETTASITVTTGGTYTVAVTSSNGCTGTSAGTTVTISPCTDITISGNIKWEHNNAPVKTVSVDLRTLPGLTFVDNNVTDVNGNYLLMSPTGGDFRIIPTKNINLLNGVTAADATRIQQHISNLVPLVGPYKRIAADVNKSNSITTYDATLITQAIAALAVFNTSWRFVPTSYVFPNPTIPWGFPEKIDLTGVTTSQINQDFIGMKIGDVNGSGNPQLKPGSPVVWAVSNQVLKSGKIIKVTFDAHHFEDIAAFQFALGFDPTQLELVDIQSEGALDMTDDNFGAFNAKEGELRAVWSTDKGRNLADGTPVFTLTFKALQSGMQLSEVLNINTSNLEALAYNTALMSTAVQLVFGEAQVSGTANPVAPELQVTLLQNTPNPFIGHTTIGFVLPQACDARLRILDINGRVITEVNKSYTAGYQQETFELTGITGVLCYELTTPFGAFTRKMTAVMR
jgi:Cohesin domain/Dockerin type I domain